MATEIPSSLTVSLRPWSDDKKGNGALEDLKLKVGLIHKQRNGFRNVRETDLEAEIAQGETGLGDDTSSEDGNSDNEEPRKGTLENVAVKRHRMNEMLMKASQNGNFLGDTISLAESSVHGVAGNSMSAALKDLGIPKGALGFGKWQNMRDNPAKIEMHNQLWKGSYMTSLTESADSILAAATRLESQVKAETEFWGQLLALTANGWPVYQRGPNLEVKFGASEAGPRFAGRGHAPLVPDSKGVIKLGQLGTEPRTLRIRLAKEGTVIASSVQSSLINLVELHRSIEDKVKRAQSSLFEEELFYEMAMESRILQPLGVVLRNNVLHLPFSSSRNKADAQTYLIDLVPLDEAAELVKTGTDENKELLNAQGVLLRLLLSHVHNLRLQRRSQIPPPLSEVKITDQPEHIIRSFLGVNHHYQACLPLSIFVSGIEEALTAAKIPIDSSGVDIHGLDEVLQDITSANTKITYGSTLHTLLQDLNRPRKTRTVLNLGKSRHDDSKHQIILHLNTTMSPPLCGSEFVVEIPADLASLVYGADSPDRRLVFPQLQELKSFLTQLLSFHLSRNFLWPAAASWKAADEAPVIYRTYEHMGKEAKEAIGVKLDSGGQVELRRRWVGEARNQDRRIWNTRTGTAADQSLLDVFDAWMNEA